MQKNKLKNNVKYECVNHYFSEVEWQEQFIVHQKPVLLLLGHITGLYSPASLQFEFQPREHEEKLYVLLGVHESLHSRSSTLFPPSLDWKRHGRALL